ncbi:MAG: hypothetical protein ABR907_09555 [Terracidiphilus sp.]|jgi:hypothetical protein
MELLDRYLQAVKKHLPWQRQDDIIAELKANLEAQLEDKEAALGRPLTAAEAEEWLKQFGHPIQAAARYQPQRSLIGPALFPFYRYVIGIALFWATVIYAIVTAVMVATQAPNAIGILGFVLRLPGIWVTTAAWVTLIFAIIEYAAARCPGKFPMLAPPSTNWSPADLPPLQPSFAGGKKPRSFAGAVAEVIFGFLFLVWWLLIPKYPYLLLGPGAFYFKDWGHFITPFQWAPVWYTFYWWVVVLHSLRLGWQCFDLTRGRWQRPHAMQQIVMSALGLIPLGILLTVPGQVYFTLRHPELDSARYGAALQSINFSIHWTAVVICVISVVTLIVGLARSGLEAYRKRVAAGL